MAMLSTDGATETHRFARRIVWAGMSHEIRATTHKTISFDSTASADNLVAVNSGSAIDHKIFGLVAISSLNCMWDRKILQGLGVFPFMVPILCNKSQA